MTHRTNRFHGRVAGELRPCAVPGCDAAGEFRTPPERGHSDDGPGAWRWMCLDHVRQFNGSYNFFAGMSEAEIQAAQHPLSGWASQRRVGDPSPLPHWQDFTDPLDAIGARFRERMMARRTAATATERGLSPADQRALAVLGLDATADRRALRRAYADLVRRYHPDRNGGDRSHERALEQVIAAYGRLRRAPAFA